MRRSSLAFLLAASLCGCFGFLHEVRADRYDDLLAAAGADPSPTNRLDPEEAMEDVKTLAHILKNGYAGWEVLDFDWNQAFVGIAKEIEGKTSLSARELTEVIVKNLGGVEDRHLGFFVGKGRSREWFPVGSDRNLLFSDFVVEELELGYWVVVKAPKRFDGLLGSRLLSVEGAAPGPYFFRTLPGPSHTPASLIGATSAGGSNQTLELEFQTGAGKSVRHEASLHPCRARLNHSRPRPYRLTRIPFPRIELGSFSTLHSESLEEFIHSAKTLRDEPIVVIDLRGNSGGSDRFGKEWLRRLTGDTKRSWRVRELISPITLQGDVLLHEWLLANNGSQAAKEEAGGRLEFFRDRLEEGRRTGVERSWKDVDIPSISPPQEGLPHPFGGRLILLTDRGTQSSAETFTLMARQVPGTVVVGENTGGMMRFGEIKLYRLPHSGIWVQAGSKHFEDPTAAFREGWGFAPDYWIDDSSLISSIPGLVERVSGLAGSDGWRSDRISVSGAGGE